MKKIVALLLVVVIIAGSVIGAAAKNTNSQKDWKEMCGRSNGLIWGAACELLDRVVVLENDLAEIELTPGPKGDAGDTGPKGDTGDTGPPGEMPEFGDYQTKSANTIYTANTDGIVVAQMHISTDDKYGYISGKTGNTSQSDTSWTIRATDAIWNNSWASITMPVRKGDMWCVNTSSEAPSYTDNVSWMPVGS